MKLDNVKAKSGTPIIYTARNGEKVEIDLAELSSYFEDFTRWSPDNIIKFCHGLPCTQSEEVRKRSYSILGGKIKLQLAFKQKFPFCRERSILAHIMLAQMGIPSILVSALSDNKKVMDTDGKYTNIVRHTFVLFQDQSGIKLLDASLNKDIIPLNIDQCYTDRGGYVYDKKVLTQEVVEPIAKDPTFANPAHDVYK